MGKKVGLSRKQLDAEVVRVEETEGEEIVIPKARYLSLLHEVKVLRFKVCRKNWRKENAEPQSSLAEPY